MKIAVSSSGNDLKSMLDSRFGRCAYFLIIDPEDLSFEVFDNQSASQTSGAGIQAAQFLADKRVTAVITGNVGPNAAQTLSAAGIDVFTEQQGTISEVVERFKKGHLKPTKDSNVNSHFGMGIGSPSMRGRNIRQGQGGGRGMGQGGGGGAGRGMGGGRGMGRGFKTTGNRSVQDKGENKISGNQELENLKEQAERLNQQMKGILTRINDLEKI